MIITSNCKNIFGFVLATLFLLSCSSFLLKKPEPPIVSISSITPLNLSFTKQKLAFKLRVFNPNPYNVSLESIDFVTSLADTELTSGASEQEVTLPANGHEFVTVEVVIRIDKLLGKVKSIFSSTDLSVGYNIRGKVKLSLWPRKISFDVEGKVSPPEKI